MISIKVLCDYSVYYNTIYVIIWLIIKMIFVVN